VTAGFTQDDENYFARSTRIPSSLMGVLGSRRQRERANLVLRRHLEAVEDDPREAKGDHHEYNEGEWREEDIPADPEPVEDEDEGT
jgi:hypothetical protein